MIKIIRVLSLIIITILLLSSMSHSVTVSDITKGGYARKLFISGNYLYLADWHSGLHIYDITYPYKPVHLANIHTPVHLRASMLKTILHMLVTTTMVFR